MDNGQTEFVLLRSCAQVLQEIGVPYEPGICPVVKRHLNNETILSPNSSTYRTRNCLPARLIYLQEFRSGVVQSLHGMAEIVRVTKIKVRRVQDGFHHIQIRGVVLHLFLGQVQGGLCIGYHVRRRYLENVMSSYSPAHLSVRDDNEITTCQETYSSYQAPYLSAAGSRRDLTGCADCEERKNKASLVHARSRRTRRITLHVHRTAVNRHYLAYRSGSTACRLPEVSCYRLAPRKTSPAWRTLARQGSTDQNACDRRITPRACLYRAAEITLALLKRYTHRYKLS